MKKLVAVFEVVSPFLVPAAVGLAVVLLLYYAAKKFGAGSPDPGGAVLPNASLLDGAINASLEVGHSSLSYTDALAQSAVHPVDTIEKILGF